VEEVPRVRGRLLFEQEVIAVVGVLVGAAVGQRDLR
jgi:hypothetical protein